MKIGILCPRGARTGGPEALHQLFCQLKLLGVDCVLVDGVFSESEPATEYEIYSPEWMDSELELESLSHLIVPETYLDLPRSFKRIFRGKIIFWWLSVDNCPHPKARLEATRNMLNASREWGLDEKDRLRHWAAFLYGVVAYSVRRARSLILGRLIIKPSKVLNISQSKYASDFVSKNFRKVPLPCSDYLTPRGEVSGILPLANLVTYNAAKGELFARKVSELLPEFEFLPLRNLSKASLLDKLATSSIYLDLGNFPGKDRIPREARREGTPVVIARRGAGASTVDFPLPRECVVDLKTTDPKSVADLVQRIGRERAQTLISQRDFEIGILQELDQFRLEVSALVEHLVENEKS